MNTTQVSAFACADLRDLLLDRETEIIEAARVISQEADDDATAKLSLSFKITIDLDANTMESVLSFSVKRSASASHSLDDPAQPALPGVDSVRDENGKDELVTLTREGVYRAERAIKRALNKTE